MEREPINMFITLSQASAKVGALLAKDQELARLLKIMDEDALSNKFPDVNWIEDLSYQHYIKNTPPSIMDDVKQAELHIYVPFGAKGPNDEFSNIQLQFDVVCPMDRWQLSGLMTRPIAVMERVYDLCDKKRVTGVGQLLFAGFELKTFDRSASNHAMIFDVNVING